MNCAKSFHDYIVRCPLGVRVNAIANVAPYSALKWLIIDKFLNEYTGDVLTEGDGTFIIPVDELPAGLLNPYSGEFELRVLNMDNNCKPEPLLVAGYYESIIFSVGNGNRIKDNLGCSMDVVFSGGGGSSTGTNDNFVGDGTETVYETTAAFVPGSEKVFVGGLLYSADEYTVTGANEITFIVPVDAGVKIRINY